MKMESIPAGAGAYYEVGMWPLSIDELVAFETRPATRAKRQRQNLPYGHWLCGDGREVLFNRNYRPIWQRMPDMAAEKADPDEWIDWIEQRYLFDDGDVSFSDRKRGITVLAATRTRLDRALSDFLIGEPVIGNDSFWCYSSPRRMKGILRDGSVVADKFYSRYTFRTPTP